MAIRNLIMAKFMPKIAEHTRVHFDSKAPKIHNDLNYTIVFNNTADAGIYGWYRRVPFDVTAISKDQEFFRDKLLKYTLTRGVRGPSY